jgi:hypothetical protein
VPAIAPGVRNAAGGQGGGAQSTCCRKHAKPIEAFDSRRSPNAKGKWGVCLKLISIPPSAAAGERKRERESGASECITELKALRLAAHTRFTRPVWLADWLLLWKMSLEHFSLRPFDYKPFVLRVVTCYLINFSHYLMFSQRFHKLGCTDLTFLIINDAEIQSIFALYWHERITLIDFIQISVEKFFDNKIGTIKYFIAIWICWSQQISK